MPKDRHVARPAQRFVVSALVGVVLAIGRTASADPTGAPSERAPAALRVAPSPCVEAVELAAQINRLSSRDAVFASEGAAAWRVHVALDASRARIELFDGAAEAPTGIRELRVERPSCEALVEAAALSIALALESEPAASLTLPPRPEPRAGEWWLGLGASMAVGGEAPLALGGRVEASARLGRWSLGAELGVEAARVSAPRDVRWTAWSAATRFCGELVRPAPTLALAVCGGVMGGLVRVRAYGVADPLDPTVPKLDAQAGLEGRWRGAPWLELTFRVDVAVPTIRNDYRIRVADAGDTRVHRAGVVTPAFMLGLRTPID